jgi:PAS domain S-box-containing protein
MFITTPDGRVTDANPACAEMFGYGSKDELLRLDIGLEVFADPGEREAFRKRLEESGSLKDHRLELRKKDGERIVALATVTAVKDGKGAIVEYQGILRDVTRAERESEALREKLEQLDLALKSADMGTWAWDIDTQRSRYDERTFQLLGIDPSTFTGTREEYFRVVHPEDRAVVRQTLLDSMKEEILYKDEYRVILPDGNIRYITGRWKVTKDPDGRPRRLHGIHWDVTDRKAAEEALKKTYDLLRTIVDTVPTAIVGLDLEGRVQSVWNRAAERMFGWSAEEAMGRFLPSVPPEGVEEFRGFLARMRDGEPLGGREVLRVRKDGSHVDCSVYASPLRDENGTVAGVIGVLVDVTERKRMEEALRESEERLKLTLEAAQIVAWEVHADGSHREAGPVHVLLGRHIGTSLPTLSDLIEAVHPEDRERIRSMLASAMRGESGYEVQFRIPQEDGTVRWIEANGALQRDARGNPVRILGMSRNITPRKAAEEALRKSEERIRSIVAALPLGMHIYRLEDDGRLVLSGANPAADRILGIDHGKLIGRTMEEAFPGLAGTEAPARYRRAALCGETWTTEHIEYDEGEIRGVFEIVAFQTSPGNMAVLFEDITERRRMHEALRSSEERFRQLVRNSNDIIALVDEKGRLTSVSGPLEKVLGYGPEELLGATLLSFVHPGDLEDVSKVLPEIIRKPGTSSVVEFRVRHKNGKWISVEVVGSNMLHDPAVKAVVSNLRDITERNRLREQLQQAMKMEAVGRLAGGVAHDFNNILTVISGNVELARMGLSPSDPLNRCLDQVAKASDSAASLTRQLLAFSRKQIIEPRVLNLNDLVRNVQQMLARLIGENVELRTNLRDDLKAVKVDPGQFEQVLVNLAVNARDAMPEGGRLSIETANVTLDERYCETHSQAQPVGYVLLAVSDTGHGMSPEVKEHLFEPFFTTKGKGRGTGLGLATIFGAVRQAGGFIEVYSEEGRGTTFKIYVPAVEEQAGKLVKAARPIDTMKGDETILLVEDEESVRKMALGILKNLGYRVFEARDGEEALMIAEKYGGRIELLMTDIVMPGINGRELSELLTGLYPSMKTLFTSGYTEDVIVHHGVIDSQINFIGKPYSLQGLAGKIREVLGPGRPATAGP